MRSHSRSLIYAGILFLLCLTIYGCISAVASGSPTPKVVEVPVTVEVIRVVSNGEVVTATPTPPRPCAASTLQDANSIVIGGLLPLSKPGAMLSGFAMQTALNIAAEDVNTSGGIAGKRVRLVSYDTAGLPDQAAEYAQRLITEDCAVALIGTYHSAVSLKVAEVAHSFGVPFIVSQAGADEITATQYPEIFRTAPAFSMFAQLPARWMAEVGDFNQDGQLSAVLVADTQSISQQQLDRIAAWFDQFNIKYEILKPDLPSDDFSSLIARIVTLEKLPDALFLYLKNPAALTLHAQLLGGRRRPAQVHHLGRQFGRPGQ